MNKRKLIGIIFIFFSVVLLSVCGALLLRSASPAPQIEAPPAIVAPPSAPAPPEVPDEALVEPLPTITSDNLPHDKLFITVERQHYEDAQLQLRIPKLEIDIPILSDVTQETLKRGVGLYDYAQLPGEGNRNVSVAGHRNSSRRGIVRDDQPFYYIDTLADGDYLYLTDSERIYRYLYESTTVVLPDDWGPIYSQGYSCLTLTSCTPIGVADHRIIVRGKLDIIIDKSANLQYDKDEYPASISEQTP